MNEVLEYWQRFKAFAKELINQIEESQAFERLVIKFESLEPRQQKAWRLGAIYLALGLVALIYFAPIWGVLSQKATIESQRKLLSELQTFNSENSVIRKPAPRPQGWTSLPAQNVKEMESALSQYAESMGIAPDFIVSSSTGSTVDLELKELSLRQALTLLFQADGYYPGMELESLRISVHPTAKDLLEMKLRARVDPALIASVSAQGGGSGNNGSGYRGSTGSGSSRFNGSGDESSGNGGPNLNPGSNSGFNDDFNGEGASPPLNFDDEDI